MNSKIEKLLVMMIVITMSIVLFSCGDEEEEPKPQTPKEWRISSFDDGQELHQLVYNTNGELTGIQSYNSGILNSTTVVTENWPTISVDFGDDNYILTFNEVDSTLSKVKLAGSETETRYIYGVNRELAQKVIFDADGNVVEYRIASVSWDNDAINEYDKEGTIWSLTNDSKSNQLQKLHPALAFLLAVKTESLPEIFFFTKKQVLTHGWNADNKWSCSDFEYDTESGNLTMFRYADKFNNGTGMMLTWEEKSN